MNAALLDTHAAIWHLLAAAELSQSATALIDDVTRRGGPLFVSAVSVLEVLYLVEKGRVPSIAFEQLTATLSDPMSDLECMPFTLDMALTARRIPRDQVPDMPDRIVAATALHLNVPLITRDRRIRATGVQTIW